jgi:IS605 OrfB family transposase
VRTRLHVSDPDTAVLRAVGGYLGSLAGRDLAARCAEGKLDARSQAESRRERKRALTAQSSSRWAGAITRTTEDAYQLAERNLRAQRASLLARLRRIDSRLAMPCAGRCGRVRGYAAPSERHQKTVRRQALRVRLAQVQAQLDSGMLSVVRAGKALLHKRNNLAEAGLTVQQWHAQWEAARLFLTADGERGKAWGNETIRWHPGEGWLEVKLPAALAHLANRQHGRYRLSATVAFSYRGDQVAAQATTGAVRYDIRHDPDSGRWYLDASWRTPPTAQPTLEELRAYPVLAVDLNAGHLAVAVLDPHGNRIGTPRTIPLLLSGLPAATRDARVRAAIGDLITAARQYGAHAVVIENLDFAQHRAEGREHAGNRPARGQRGRRFRRAVAGIPTARFRDRLVQMCHNTGLAIVVVDPAYTSRWAAQHWLAPLRAHHPQTSGHHAAAVVIGRRGLGHRARRRVTGNQPAPVEAARSTQTRPGTTPTTQPTQRKPATPTDLRQPTRHKTGPPQRAPAGNQAAQDRSGPPANQDTRLLVH